MADPAFDIISAGSGASATAAGSTITFQYPTLRALANYMYQSPAYLGVRALQGVYVENQDFTVSYGASNITVTLGSTIPAIPANSPVTLQAPVRETSGQPVDAEGYVLPTSAIQRPGL